MIISVSRRTDIPAWYADWFFNRLREGFVCARNPMNPHQVSRISLQPDCLDGFVFWTKNPTPMMQHLPLLEPIPYYMQITLTAYGRDLEPGLPDKQTVLVPAFQALARQIGPQRLVWRYDPILLSPVYSVDFHIRAFRDLAQRLNGCTDTCVISFFDDYRHLQSTVRECSLRAPDAKEIAILAEELSRTARACGMRLVTCSEAMDLSAYGIGHSCCIDASRLSDIGGIPLMDKKDPNQREACGCTVSVDIGMYDSCPNGCRYCYANHSVSRLRNNLSQHDPCGVLLFGQLQADDRITDRVLPSLRDTQLTLF